VVISHDRALLIILQIILRSYYGRIYDYKANTSIFRMRKDRRIHQQKHMMNSNVRIADNRTFIDRFKGTFSKTDAVQSRVKMRS
jgi:ATP-binding cassette subfamily F protein 3